MRWARWLCRLRQRGDPLPPLPVTPQAVTSLKLAQRGDTLEITYDAACHHRGARLGLLDIEILRADVNGDFQKMAKRSKRRAAPGESLAETSPFRRRARRCEWPPALSIAAVSPALSSVATLVVQSPPPAPHDLTAEMKGSGSP